MRQALVRWRTPLTSEPSLRTSRIRLAGLRYSHRRFYATLVPAGLVDELLSGSCPW